MTVLYCTHCWVLLPVGRMTCHGLLGISYTKCHPQEEGFSTETIGIWWHTQVHLFHGTRVGFSLASILSLVSSRCPCLAVLLSCDKVLCWCWQEKQHWHVWLYLHFWHSFHLMLMSPILGYNHIIDKVLCSKHQHFYAVTQVDVGPETCKSSGFLTIWLADPQGFWTWTATLMNHDHCELRIHCHTGNA